jgi:hypothetical protein
MAFHFNETVNLTQNAPRIENQGPKAGSGQPKIPINRTQAIRPSQVIGALHETAAGGDVGLVKTCRSNGHHLQFRVVTGQRKPEEEFKMKKIMWMIAALCFLFTAGTAFAADANADAKKMAISLVDKAIAHIKKVGPETAYKDFSDKAGAFVDGAFYVFVVDFKGMTLAHGGNPGLVGKSMYELKDADGQLFIQNSIKVAQDKGTGWVDYKWSNPTTKKIEPKSTYVARVEGTEYFVGCGIYLKN